MTIAGCSASIMGLFARGLPAALLAQSDVELRLLSGAQAVTEARPILGILPYQTVPDAVARSRPPSSRDGRGGVPLPLRIAYLVALWGEAPAALEQALIDACLHLVEDQPFLTGAALAEGHVWHTDASIRLSLDPLAPDALTGLWRALGQPMRLALPLSALVA